MVDLLALGVAGGDGLATPGKIKGQLVPLVTNISSIATSPPYNPVPATPSKMIYKENI